ncbi:hypothetical protein P175DRAFT_0560448 [Aspergillus ochraceoroseus IBT 24754]|uniref:Uncharacterized protein n=1 Tax=Aspergillus ochraceoroseus IBT 24754 TaxID=1392256 RepID=A0A2T5LN99_9EURO|nr:uncharacterized protein P175DRAFT_0560448 [Aspergillus ochraceoroseus IBT 24754]PTU17752.1 hypothetical protein P175DRAFT_0560448 [Aspergillus ochraceoroseus IBT 24754]
MESSRGLECREINLQCLFPLSTYAYAIASLISRDLGEATLKQEVGNHSALTTYLSWIFGLFEATPVHAQNSIGIAFQMRSSHPIANRPEITPRAENGGKFPEYGRSIIFDYHSVSSQFPSKSLPWPPKWCNRLFVHPDRLALTVQRCEIAWIVLDLLWPIICVLHWGQSKIVVLAGPCQIYLANVGGHEHTHTYNTYIVDTGAMCQPKSRFIAIAKLGTTINDLLPAEICVNG